jgi:hypothetical protein
LFGLKRRGIARAPGPTKRAGDPFRWVVLPSAAGDLASGGFVDLFDQQDHANTNHTSVTTRARWLLCGKTNSGTRSRTGRPSVPAQLHGMRGLREPSAAWPRPTRGTTAEGPDHVAAGVISAPGRSWTSAMRALFGRHYRALDRRPRDARDQSISRRNEPLREWARTTDPGAVWSAGP